MRTHCERRGRKLTDVLSQERGIGPDCWEKVHHPPLEAHNRIRKLRSLEERVQLGKIKPTGQKAEQFKLYKDDMTVETVGPPPLTLLRPDMTT
jgi:hypothetical protein